MDAPNRLAGLRVLVLEDEALLAMLLEDVLAEFGCTPVGPFGHCKEAIAFLGSNPQGCDVGILDVNVSGQRSDVVAIEFDRLGLPFVFSTGYDESAFDERWRGKPSLTKPFRSADLERVLLEVLQA
ncbi:MAG TPA: response regulator [Acidisoma sp.]|jgi:two-component SAPR family response regulator|uniref:response regulator n=1 Tax=Acidisoma sp. TaxID=1872115 RepID=UPI002CC22B85|nr:response regulator [Acidisoma sp.]HTI03358.1 response regulator [Acidisoma sp.]